LIDISIQKIVLIWFFLISITVIDASQPPVDKRVLILHSYHQGYKWTDDIHQGIVDILNKEENIELCIEYMDLIRNQSDETLVKLEELYTIKYTNKNIRFDAIVVSDDNAFNFIIEKRDILFKDSPIIFCGINDFSADRIKNIPNITGVNEEKSIRQTIEVALQINKQTKKIAVVSGSRLTEHKNAASFTETMKNHFNQFESIYLTNMEPEELTENLKELSDDTIVLYLSYLLSPSGKNYSYQNGIKIVTNATSSMVFVTSDFMILDGVLGGCVSNAYYQGETAAQMTTQIMNGRRTSQIPVAMKSHNTYIFNDNVLNKYSIPDSALPANSTIINQLYTRFLDNDHHTLRKHFIGYELFEKHGAIMLFIDPRTGIIVDANRAARDFYGYPRLEGKLITDINTLSATQVALEMNNAKLLKKNFFHFKHKLSNGLIKDIYNYSYPITINNTTLLLSIIFDVSNQLKAEKLSRLKTIIIFIILLLLLSGSILFILILSTLFNQRKEADKKMDSQLHFLNTLLDTIPNPVFYKDISGKYTGCNKAFEAYLERPRNEIIGKTVFEMAPKEIAYKYYEKDSELFANPSKIQSYEWEVVTKTGDYKSVLFHKAVLFDKQLKIINLVGVITDITERKRTEEKLLAIIKEKKILIQELYHRTKNNMQVISSMIALQNYKCKNNDLKNILLDIENRIKSMALVHQKLYQSQNLSKINFCDYLNDLIDILFTSFNIKSNMVSFSVESENISLVIDLAIPCGLICNELITNSLKYAFHETGKGEIKILVKNTENNSITLHYSDTGVGLPADFNYKQSETLGMMMIVSLVEHQLGGKIQIPVNGKGFNCLIEFKNNSYSERI